MGRYPVISISLKGVEAEDYNTACEMFSRIIANEAMRFSILKDSDVLDSEDKRQYKDLITGTLNIPNLVYSILTLSRLLHKHYGEQVVVLLMSMMSRWRKQMTAVIMTRWFCFSGICWAMC